MKRTSVVRLIVDKSSEEKLKLHRPLGRGGGQPFLGCTAKEKREIKIEF